MKKIFSMAAIALMGLATFTSCSDDDDNSGGSGREVMITDGVLLINSGNKSGGIDGSVTNINPKGWTSEGNVFKTANNRSIGMTANDAITYGSKLYIVVTGENTVEVADRNNMKSLKQISTTQLMGEDKGKQPRHVISGNGCVYVSTFDGYVAVIDTTDYSLKNTYQVGSYPEGMALNGNKLYVCNSDYGMGNASISTIDLSTGGVSEFKSEKLHNCVSIHAEGDALYVLDYGQYDANWNQLDAGVYKVQNGEVSKVADATMMAVSKATGGTKIYTVNAPYSYPAVVPSYQVFDVNNGTLSTFITGDDVASPAAIGVDPVTGYVFIASYTMNPDTGYANYRENCYVNVYGADGKLVRRVDGGVGPVAFTFNYSTVKVFD